MGCCPSSSSAAAAQPQPIGNASAESALQQQSTDNAITPAMIVVPLEEYNVSVAVPRTPANTDEVPEQDIPYASYVSNPPSLSPNVSSPALPRHLDGPSQASVYYPPGVKIIMQNDVGPGLWRMLEDCVADHHIKLALMETKLGKGFYSIPTAVMLDWKKQMLILPGWQLRAGMLPVLSRTNNVVTFIHVSKYACFLTQTMMNVFMGLHKSVSSAYPEVRELTSVTNVFSNAACAHYFCMIVLMAFSQVAGAKMFSHAVPIAEGHGHEYMYVSIMNPGGSPYAQIPHKAAELISLGWEWVGSLHEVNIISAMESWMTTVTVLGYEYRRFDLTEPEDVKTVLSCFQLFSRFEASYREPGWAYYAVSVPHPADFKPMLFLIKTDLMGLPRLIRNAYFA